jgi:amino acid transporter
MPISADPSETGQPSLKRQLRLSDLILTQVLFVVGTSWVGTAAGLERGHALTWMTAMLVFYLPMAASVICLNRQMPLEGGLYVWARQGFGDFPGFLVAWNIWVYSIGVAAEILYAMPTEVAYLIGPSASWLPESRSLSLAIVFAILLIIAMAAVRGLAVGKWFQTVGGAALLAVFTLLILLPAIALLRGQPIAWEPLPIGLPPQNLFTLARLGQMMIGGLAGLEYIAILAGETRSPARSITQSTLIASPIICAMFILGTSSVLAFARGHIAGIDLIAPIPQTFRLAFGSRGIGSLIAIAAIVALLLRLLGTASLVFTGATRLSLTAGWDHLLPAWFTRLHPRWKTPTNSVLFTALLIVTSLLVASAGVHAQEAFQVLLNASTAHYALAYMAMFAIPLAGAAALRRTLPAWLKVTSAVGFLATFFSLAISAYPFVAVVNAPAYAAKILGTTLLSNAAAAAFYLARKRVSQS